MLNAEGNLLKMYLLIKTFRKIYRMKEHKKIIKSLALVLFCLLALTLISCNTCQHQENKAVAREISGEIPSEYETTMNKKQDKGNGFTRINDDRWGIPKDMGTGKKAMICGTTTSSAIYIGFDVLKQGGSAVDAALSTALAQIVLHGGATVSFAGWMNMVYYEAKTGRTYSLGAGFNTLQEEDDPMSISLSSPAGVENKSTKPTSLGRTVLVPGFMAGVEAAHRRFGNIPFESIFEPAIDLAENGFSWSLELNHLFNESKDILFRLDETRAVFTKENGEFYNVGDIFKQLELARTLKSVSKKGAGYMYTGEWANKFVKVVQSEGGKLTMKDLADYKVEWREPVIVNYHGYDIHLFHEAFPMAAILNIAETADIAGMEHYTRSPESFYWLARIMRVLAMSYNMSNQTSPYEPEDLLNKKRAQLIWDHMRRGEFTGIPAPQKDDLPNHTDAIVAIDEQGNVVALLHTINTGIWGKNGIFIDGVSIPDSASRLQEKIRKAGPGRRLHVGLPPLIVMKNNKPVMTLSGVGRGLPQETLKVLINMIDFNMNPKDANDAVSFIPSSDPKQEQVTSGALHPDLLRQVRKMGLQIEEIPITEANRKRGGIVNIRIDPETKNMEGAVPLPYNGIALGY